MATIPDMVINVRTERAAPVRCMEWLDAMRDGADNFVKKAMDGTPEAGEGRAMLERIVRRAYESGFLDGSNWQEKEASNDKLSDSHP